MPLHDGAPFLAKMGTSTPRLPVGEWGHQPIAGAYADSEGTEVQVEAVTLTIEQAAAMNFPGEEPEKPKRAPRKTAAAGTTTPRTPRKRATPAAAE